MDTELLLFIGGLALLDTLSPTVIGVTLYLLLTDNRNLTSRLFIYVFTVAFLYFTLGVLLMLGLGFIIETISTVFQNRIISWIIFVIGGLLFICSFFISTDTKKVLPKPKSPSIPAIIGIGVVTFVIEGGTALPYFAAIGLLTTSDLAGVEWITILASYNFIMIVPSLLLYISYKALGNRINRPLTKLKYKIAQNTGSTLSWVMCIVGVILIFNTLDYL